MKNLAVSFPAWSTSLSIPALMSADFWAGYISGAAGIVIGNPLDIVKVQLQSRSSGGVPAGRRESSGRQVLQAAGGPDAPRNSGEQALGGGSLQLQKTRQSIVPDGLRRLARGVAPPLLTYGPLNALLFVSYNRSLYILDHDVVDASNPPASTSLGAIWLAGAIGGFATWIVSTPTESIKCRAQVTSISTSGSSGAGGGSFAVARQLWLEGCESVKKGRWKALGGVRALYTGGAITSVRDAVGYGFYFWTYELCKRNWTIDETADRREQAVRVLLCGGIAGVATWASIFPLDVIKTRLQTQDLLVARGLQSYAAGPSTATAVPAAVTATATAPSEQQALLQPQERASEPGARSKRLGAWEIAKTMYRNEGMAAFFRGLGVCSVRAFIVNAVQWAVYEWTMSYLRKP